MLRTSAILGVTLAALLALAPASAQDDQQREREQLRRRILERVDVALQREVARLRAEIAALLDRELGLAESDRTVAAERPVRPEHPEAAEHPTRPERPVRPNHPTRPTPKPEVDEDDIDAVATEVQELGSRFEQAMAAHTAGRYDEAIEGFKKVAEASPDSGLQATSQYNIACGYALKGDKGRAVRWLRKSIESGFHDADHIASDSDLTSIRDTKEFKALIEEARRLAAEEGEDGEMGEEEMESEEERDEE